MSASSNLRAGILSVLDSGLFQGTALWGTLCVWNDIQAFSARNRRTDYRCDWLIALMKSNVYATAWGRERCASKLLLRIQRDFSKRHMFYKAEEQFTKPTTFLTSPTPSHPISILLLWSSKSLFIEHDGREKTYAKLMLKFIHILVGVSIENAHMKQSSLCGARHD